MRIAHIESGRHLYGGARQVLHLARQLRERGVDNILVCMAGSAIAAPAADFGEVIELPLRGDLDAGAVRRLRRALLAASRRPDIVHVHSRRGADLYGGLASIAAPWRAVLSRRVDHRERAAWARFKYRPYGAIVAISRVIERELVEHVGLARERVHLIPSGVPVAGSERGLGETACAEWAVSQRGEAQRQLASALALPDDALIAAVIGQLIPRKGHRVLLEALPGILDRHPRWHVVMFGRGPLEAELRRSIARRGLEGRVHLAGFRPDLAAYLPGIDLVLHPALREGLGLAVLEAMSAGVPVAASAAGGLPDAIEDGVSGRLVPPGDVGAWARVLEQLLAEPASRARLAAAGRRRVQASFGVQQMALSHLALYRRLR